MKNRCFSILLIGFVIFVLPSNTFAQDDPQWHLPEGAKARLGKGDINEITYSPDGTLLAVASSIGIWIYDTQTGEEVALFVGHTGWVRSVAYSPDSNTLASGSADNTIRLWGAWTGTHLRILSGHTGWVRSVAFSPDGTTIASGSSDNTLHLWNTQTGTHLRTLSGHTNRVYSVAFSPDGTTIASGSWDGTVLLWELVPSPTSNAILSLSPAAPQSPATGQQLTLSLKIADAEDIAGYQATVPFDIFALRYIESMNGDYLPAGAFFIPPVVEGNTVTLAASSLAGESDGDGTLATITFEVIAVKASTVRLTDVLLTDRSAGSSTPQIENAEISAPPQLSTDVNKDGIVNVIDLTLVAANFRKTGANDADVNNDGVVNVIDLTLVAAAFGNTAAAPEIWSLPPEDPPTSTQVKQWLSQARQMNLSDTDFQRGIRALEQLLAVLTPKETVLLPNYPNPFNPETWIPYHLAKSTGVTVNIYAANGAVVRTFALGHQVAGVYQSKSRAAYWDGKNALGELVASGVYFYTLTAGDFKATRKMLIRK
ncbi:MAG: T9SS type A sorting domain-containing protein [Candidatus Poribacteria bacterium]|nr:T9SS type A sorting domain-containing protein [Candidatus Poribacteria bacterium]